MKQIPEEEKNLGPQSRIIHVYHFTKRTSPYMVHHLDAVGFILQNVPFEFVILT